jgi:hypothetical protein
LINNVGDVKSFIEDCISDLPYQWELLLGYVGGTNNNEEKEAYKEI